MSSPEYEKFEMSQGDMDDVFHPAKRRKLSKNQATYGIWADDSSDSDDASYRSKRKNKDRDLTTPMSFISAGINNKEQPTKIKTNYHDEEDEPISDDEVINEKTRETKQTLRNFRNGVTTPNVIKSNEFGCWEKHTKGIGSKLLLKSGYVPGKGLGKNLQGFSAPVEAVQRKGRGAIGLYGTEKSEQTLKQERKKGSKRDGEGKEKDDGEYYSEFKPKLKRWKKGEKEKLISNKKYLTAEELSRNLKRKKLCNNGITKDVSNIKVIDLTGKNQKIMQGYHAISQRHNMPEDEDDNPNSSTAQPKLFDLPELLHNLDLLVDLREEKIVQNQKRLEFQKDLFVNLDYEYKKINGFYKETEDELLRFEEFMKILDECKEAFDSLSLADAMKQCSAHFNKLKTEFHEEYLLHDLSAEIMDILSPAIKKEFENWDPLKDPKRGSEVMVLIKEVLSSSSQINFRHSMARGDDMDKFDKILWDNVMPKIRAVVRCWNVRDSNSLLKILDSWSSIMPQWMISNLLDQFIYIKLQTELEKWNPFTDSLPLHTWIHPWLLVMGDRMANFYPIIQQKLANALTYWKVNDLSAKVVLEPWVGVFDKNRMNIFLVKNILPKLIAWLREINMSPLNSNFESLKFVTAWVDMIPYSHMVNAIKDNFFPKLLRVLKEWVSSSVANFNDARNWLQKWKLNLTEKLVAEPIIRSRLAEAMSIINRAAHPSIDIVQKMLQLETCQEDNTPHPLYSPNSKQSSREIKLIQELCTERGISFVPCSAKTKYGHQVYKIGPMLIYFDDDTIYYFETLQWKTAESLNFIINKVD